MTREDASTRWGPASSRSWRPADRSGARSVLPAPESEALDVNASVAPATRIVADRTARVASPRDGMSPQNRFDPHPSAFAANQLATPKHLPRLCSGHTASR